MLGAKDARGRPKPLFEQPIEIRGVPEAAAVGDIGDRRAHMTGRDQGGAGALKAPVSQIAAEANVVLLKQLLQIAFRNPLSPSYAAGCQVRIVQAPLYCKRHTVEERDVARGRRSVGAVHSGDKGQEQINDALLQRLPFGRRERSYLGGCGFNQFDENTRESLGLDAAGGVEWPPSREPAIQEETIRQGKYDYWGDAIEGDPPFLIGCQKNEGSGWNPHRALDRLHFHIVVKRQKTDWKVGPAGRRGERLRTGS